MGLINTFALMIVLTFASDLPVSGTFRGKDLFKGSEVEISPGKKGLVVAFLSARCPCSNSHIPELVDLSKVYSDFGFVGVHSNPDEDDAQTVAYFEHIKLPFPVLDDKTQTLAGKYKALKTPHIFVLARDGAIAFQGGVSDAKDCAKSGRKFLREALDDLENGRKVRNPSVRTLGCAIMRKSHVQ